MLAALYAFGLGVGAVCLVIGGVPPMIAVGVWVIAMVLMDSR